MPRSVRTRRPLCLCAILVALCAAAPATAQRATERYIPLGQSPGVSHTQTVVGAIRAVDAARRSITVAAPSGAVTAEVTDRTHIWVDRTKSGQTNLDGGFADLRTGRPVEVKFADPVRRGAAEWIKVEP